MWNSISKKVPRGWKHDTEHSLDRFDLEVKWNEREDKALQIL